VSCVRATDFFLPTLKDDPADAEAISHRLLVRGGFVRQVGSGLYTYLPLGQRVMLKIESIIREEMNTIGVEWSMPVLLPAELWKASGRYDVETIALHEIGHLSGLGHSAIGETETGATGRKVTASGSVMFPIAFGAGVVTNRNLQPDDIAGISDLYPDGGFAAATGTVSGLIVKNGQGVYGAHVVAFNPATGTMVGNFTLKADGSFTIAGLSPGPHVLRVEPLDDGDVESFVGGTPDLDFRVTFSSRFVVVPAGGDSGSVTINVVRK